MKQGFVGSQFQEVDFPTAAFSVDSAPTRLTSFTEHIDLRPKTPGRKRASSWGKSRPGLSRLTGKTFDDVGAGTREIRIREASGIYRVMYVAKFEDAIYVLHCFQEKTQATSKQDTAVAAARYRAVINARKEKK